LLKKQLRFVRVELTKGRSLNEVPRSTGNGAAHLSRPLPGAELLCELPSASEGALSSHLAAFHTAS